MPVSPQDFELYSRMTGTPMPTDAMSRMQMAPEVFKFTKDFAKKPNILEKTGNLVKNIGRNTLVGAGLLAGMDLENQQRQQQELMRSEADKAQSEAVTMNDPVEEIAPAPELTAIEKGELAKQETARIKTDEQIRLEQARAKLRNIAVDKPDTPIEGSYTRTKMIKTDPPQYEEEVIDPFPQEPTTADSYGQDYVPNQTASNIVDRKITQGSQIADSTPNIAEVLSETQDSNPVDTSFPVGDARRNMRSVEEIEKNLQDDMETASLTRIGGPEGGVGKSKLAKFLTQKGLDQALLGAIGERMTPEPRIGDSSPLLDHPDVIGGEDDAALPGGTNTSPTTNLEDHYGDMRRMEAQERIKRKSPSQKQVNLLEQRAIANEEAIASGFMNLDDEGRKKESIRLGSTGGIPNKTDMAEIRKSPEFIAAQESMKPKSTAEKTDDFTAKFVEGARSDIVRGARGNKSLGITRIPATNGDAQVGFVLANKPLDQSPMFATTYGFGVAPGAESLLDNQLNRDTFSSYMQRGMKEAQQGKKRKAGEIFEFLIPQQRIVTGDARLGDIVM